MLDVERARAQFPALAMTLDDGRPCVFLDNPAGTQVPRRVIDAVVTYYTSSNANTDGAFLTSRRSDNTILQARQAMADLLGAPEPDCIVLGPNTTTLTFSISRAIGRELRAGDEILCTTLDHDANIAPWLALEEDRGVRVQVVDIKPEDGTLDMDDFARKLSARTRLVAATCASNALGTITDAARITRMAHDAGALMWFDAVQYAAHGLIDVAALDCDFLACSSYKFFGPHAGIVYGKRAHLERLRPYKVRPASDEIPDRWETGTGNFEGLAGVANAVDYIASLGAHAAAARGVASRRAWIEAAMSQIKEYERGLGARLIAGLQDLDGATVYGITDPARFDQRAPTAAFTLAGYTPDEVAARLGEEGIFVWSGNYYALAVMERLGLEEHGGAVRIGPVHYNTPAEIDRAIGALRTLVMERSAAGARA